MAQRAFGAVTVEHQQCGLVGGEHGGRKFVKRRVRDVERAWNVANVIFAGSRPRIDDHDTVNFWDHSLLLDKFKLDQFGIPIGFDGHRSGFLGYGMRDWQDEAQAH